jgi:tRNA1(Val) A37 N6-methylase TrmN6
MVTEQGRVKAKRPMERGENAEEATTLDALMGGRVRLRQPRVGYRAGLDASLLAAAVEATAGERLIEAGCGVGAALLQAAARAPEARFTGVERDPAALALARENAIASALPAEVVEGDVDGGFRALGLPVFDAAFSNPPYFDDPASIRAPHPARRGAYMAEGGFERWAQFLLKAVREGGRLTVIHRADRLADIFAALGAKAGSFQVRPVHPFADAPAKRVLVRAVKTGKAPLRLLPPLVLHERGRDGWTPATEAILTGEARLEWMQQ